MSRPSGIVIDPNGNLRVTDVGKVITFKPQSTGNVTPLGELTSAALKTPRGLNFDPAGHMLVAAAGAHAVDTFAAGATGAAAPLSVLTGQSPGLARRRGSVDTGDLFVADTAASSVLEYPPASSGSAAPLATISAHEPGLPFRILSKLTPYPRPACAR